MKATAGLLLLFGCVSSAEAVTFYQLDVTRKGDVYRVVSDVYLNAPLKDVKAVVTDYNHLDRISGAIQMSKLLSRLNANTVYVYTVTRACFAFFCRSLSQVQRVEGLPDNWIKAYTLDNRSQIRDGYAEWHLEKQGDGTRMHWQTRLDPNVWVPPLIGKAIIKSALRTQGYNTARGIEKLARERAHLPPLGQAKGNRAKAVSGGG